MERRGRGRALEDEKVRDHDLEARTRGVRMGHSLGGLDVIAQIYKWHRDMTDLARNDAEKCFIEVLNDEA